ncbi:hypothetical protein CAPTEDRAFT_142937 [Capitella teleta]|uniref:Transporter n=1 Tax=Capitella teleta TaxID=283909 RepID=R7V9F1_CAPTE|nr:hypothetical protein CAPTEDRAFT_142937 [Capitella teleta]|eukprot:ELU15127.1 hypothetical protein CAPTEDRAFT_142937 [Capitella teleta]
MPARQQWSKEVEFVLACVGNAVGLGNLWRFPYLCYDSGGGAFLIPYFIMLIVCGIPLLYMELAMGQYTRQGPVGALKKLCPFFQGAGMGTVMLSFLLCTYYNVILTWAMYYMFSVFTDPLPWSHCNNSWNSKMCWGDYSNSSIKPPNNSVSPSQEFYENHILQQTDGIEDQGSIIWQLALILLLSWVLVYLCLFKGVRWTGKAIYFIFCVVYFTAIFPYIIIITLLVKGLTLPGSEKGVEFFIKPRWELLKDPKVWVNAAAQNFNSIGIAFGSMVAFSSYNKRNNKILRDVLSICLLNSATSILAGFAIFSILGYIALNQGKEVSEVVSEGPGLVFIVYPEAFTSLNFPGSNILAFLFFFMLLCLAIDSQFASVEVVLTTLDDHFGVSLRRILKRKELVVLIVCAFAYLLGLPNITNGGIYFFKLIDTYSSGISLMLIAFFEVIAVAWGYGAHRLAKNIEEMTGSRPYLYFLICWFALSPLLISAIMIFNWIQYTPISYGDYEYPDWGIGIGWLLASLSLVCIPIGIVKAIWEAEGSNFFQVRSRLLVPNAISFFYTFFIVNHELILSQ